MPHLAAGQELIHFPSSSLSICYTFLFWLCQSHTCRQGHFPYNNSHSPRPLLPPSPPLSPVLLTCPPPSLLSLQHPFHPPPSPSSRTYHPPPSSLFPLSPISLHHFSYPSHPIDVISHPSPPPHIPPTLSWVGDRMGDGLFSSTDSVRSEEEVFGLCATFGYKERCNNQ